MLKWVCAPAVALLFGWNVTVSAQTISASQHRTCATSAQGEMYCWGKLQWGPYALNGIAADSAPIPAVSRVPGTRFRQVATGWLFDCALMTGGKVFCDGVDYESELGRGSTSTVSARAATDVQFRSITAGNWHTCGLTASGRAYCWGNNEAGQTGVGTRDSVVDRPTPVVGGHRFRMLSAGARHTCGITTSGITMCWGANNAGQLGREPRLKRCNPADACMAVPARLDDERAFVSVASGYHHTCAITRGGELYCWGEFFSNYHQQMAPPRRLPLSKIGLGVRFRSISAGLNLTCGLTDDALAYCFKSDPFNTTGRALVRWGCDRGYQCLDGVPVSRTLRFRAVTAGHYHACGIELRGNVYCWGLQDVRQVGSRQEGLLAPRCDERAAPPNPRCALTPFRVMTPNLLTGKQPTRANTAVGDPVVRDTVMEHEIARLYRLVARRVGLAPIFGKGSGDVEFELRVWGAIGRDQLPMFVIRKDNLGWTAAHVSVESTTAPFVVITRSPNGDWEQAWKGIDSLGLLTMPVRPPVPSSRRVSSDSRIVAIELRRGNEYRSWLYDLDIDDATPVVNPDALDDRMRRIVEFIRRWPTQ